MLGLTKLFCIICSSTDKQSQSCKMFFFFSQHINTNIAKHDQWLCHTGITQAKQTQSRSLDIMQQATKACCSASLQLCIVTKLLLSKHDVRPSIWSSTQEKLFTTQLSHPCGCTCHVCSRRLWKKGQTVLHGHCCPLKSLTGVNWPYWLALMCLLFVCLPSLSVSGPQETKHAQ